MFIIYAQDLSSLIEKSISSRDLHGTSICQSAPRNSHLLFADNCFLFFWATLEECNNMKSILTTYELASGQAINYNKSSIFFIRNVPHDV